jgi:hypothetical protein
VDRPREPGNRRPSQGDDGVHAGRRGNQPRYPHRRYGGRHERRLQGKRDDAKKTLTIKETLANGTSLTGTGDWSSPLAIRYESQPAPAGKQSVRIRRTYSILSAQSFSIAEEISIDGGPFQRLGNGLFQKN